MAQATSGAAWHPTDATPTSSWHLTENGTRLVYGSEQGAPQVSLSCGPKTNVEVWIADPNRSYQTKQTGKVMLTALHDIEEHPIRYDRFPDGRAAIVYSVEASSLMWTALLMDRGVGLYNSPEKARIPGEGASQLVKGFIPQCLSPGGSKSEIEPASLTTPSPTSTVVIKPVMSRPAARSEGTMPAVVSQELMRLYKSCKKPEVEKGFVNSKDVNGDGIPDWYLDYDHYTCDGAGFCGSAGCKTTLFVSSPHGYTKVWDDNAQAMSFRTVGGKAQAVFDLHGTYCGRTGVDACQKVIPLNGSRTTSTR